MPIIKKGLFTVWEKFPDDKDKVKRLFRERRIYSVAEGSGRGDLAEFE